MMVCNMLELLMMSVLGATYVSACKEERKEEKINELKLKVFWYAVKHSMLYNDVVKLIEENKLTIEDIENEGK